MLLIWEHYNTAPILGAMKTFRQSIYSDEYTLLTNWLIDKRKSVNLTQRALAKNLGVVHSLVGKVEKGERRLDILEFIAYCKGMQVIPSEFIELVENSSII